MCSIIDRVPAWQIQQEWSLWISLTRIERRILHRGHARYHSQRESGKTKLGMQGVQPRKRSLRGVADFVVEDQIVDRNSGHWSRGGDDGDARSCQTCLRYVDHRNTPSHFPALRILHPIRYHCEARNHSQRHLAHGYVRMTLWGYLGRQDRSTEGIPQPECQSVCSLNHPTRSGIDSFDLAG